MSYVACPAAHSFLYYYRQTWSYTWTGDVWKGRGVQRLKRVSFFPFLLCRGVNNIIYNIIIMLVVFSFVGR